MMRFFIVLFVLHTFDLFALEGIDFQAKIYDKNEMFKLSDYLGKKTIVINFFSSWCAPCATEIPELNMLKKRYKESLFIAVNAAEKDNDIKNFLRKYPFDYIVLEDPGSLIATLYGISSLPTTIVINPFKKIVYRDKVPPKEL